MMTHSRELQIYSIPLNNLFNTTTKVDEHALQIQRSDFETIIRIWRCTSCLHTLNKKSCLIKNHDK